MHNEKFYLTTQDILDKEFKIDARGYRPQEVDKFLDMFMSDFTEFMNIIKKLEKENRILTEENNRIKMEYRKLRDNIESASEGTGATGNNLDLLRRLSNLEKIVYGREN